MDVAFYGRKPGYYIHKYPPLQNIIRDIQTSSSSSCKAHPLDVVVSYELSSLLFQYFVDSVKSLLFYYQLFLVSLLRKYDPIAAIQT